MAERDYEKLAAQYRKEAQEMKSEPKRSPYSELSNAAKAMQTKDSQKPMTKEQAEREAEALRKLEEAAPTTKTEMGKKKGGCVKMAKGGYVKAADGCAQRGKTRGKMV